MSIHLTVLATIYRCLKCKFAFQIRVKCVKVKQNHTKVTKSLETEYDNLFMTFVRFHVEVYHIWTHKNVASRRHFITS